MLLTPLIFFNFVYSESVPWCFKTKEQILGYGGLFQRPSPVVPVLNRYLASYL